MSGCQKRKYSKKQAQKELQRFKDLKRFMPLLHHKHIYFCPYHKCWHLTSQESKRDIRQVDKGADTFGQIF